MRHNKVKCLDCKYHGFLYCCAEGNFTYEGKTVACMYSANARDEGVLVIRNGKVIDRRGNDPDDCKLFERG